MQKRKVEGTKVKYREKAGELFGSLSAFLYLCGQIHNQMAVETTRWGILYCPKNSITSKQKRWQKIETLLKQHDIVYDMVQSETASRSAGRRLKPCSNSTTLSTTWYRARLPNLWSG